MKKRKWMIFFLLLVAMTGIQAQEDYDGDGWIGTEDQPPMMFGEFIADIPSLRLEFDATIEPGIEILVTSTQTVTDYLKEFNKTEKTVNYTVTSNAELKSNFSAGIGGIFGGGTKDDDSSFKLTNPFNFNAGVELKRTETWNQTTRDEMTHFIEQYYERKSKNEITVDEYAGFVRTQLKFTNLSHFPADLKITNIRVHAVSYNPENGTKIIFAEETLSDEILLYSGAGNNTATRFIEFTGINTYDMERAFKRGDMFDVEISGDYLAKSPDGSVDWRGRISSTLSKTMWVKVDYGDINTPAVRQVAIRTKDGSPLTLEKALIEMYGSEVEFDYHPVTGERIIKRIMHRTIKHADRDYSTLSLDEQNEYGRWIIGYAYGSRNIATTFTVDTTALYQGDIIGIYFLTKDDFQNDLPDPDQTINIGITPDNGSASNGILVIDEPVKPGDQIELDVNNYFTIYKQGSKYYDGVSYSEYGLLINATFYFRTVDANNDLFIPVPDLNWYGIKVSFGTANPMTWYNVEDLAYKLVSRGDFPEYTYAVRFVVTESMLNGLSQGVLRIAQDKTINGSITVGVKGYDVAGTPFEYLNSQTNEERSANIEIKWYKHDPDIDGDGYHSIAFHGNDWCDNDITVHPGAAELWDAKDNNQDGSSETIIINGPHQLMDGQSGVYTAQVLNWSGSQPSFNWYTSAMYPNGTTGPWQDLGSGSSKTITMPASSTGVDIKVLSRVYMYDPVIHTNRWFELTHHEIVSNNKPVLMGWWKLNGNYNDSSGNNYTGTPVNNPAFSTGRIQQAVNLNGSNSYIQIADYSPFNELFQFTLAAWIYPESTGSRTIIAKVNPNRDFVFKITTDGRLQAHFAHGASYYAIYSDNAIPLNTWSHVAATWDGFCWRLYLNGSGIKVADFNGVVPPHTGRLFGIGTMNWGEIFDGKIDDVRVYDGAWNEEGIKSIYDEAPPELMGWWKLDGNYNDSSGNNCTGTPMNGPVFETGCIGQAVLLDGINDHIRIQNYSPFNDMPTFSLTAWIYPTAYNQSNTIVSRVYPNRDFVLKLNSTGKLQAHFAQGSSYYTITSNQTIPLMKWSHVTATWDGRYWRLYLDGNLIKQEDHNGHSPPHTGTRLGIGTMNWSEFFAGRIDDVRIYKGVLKPVSIRNIYDEAPKPLSCTINGPRLILIPQKGQPKIIKTWTAGAEGGTSPYTYTWYKKWESGSYFKLCNGTGYSESFSYDGNGPDSTFMLKLELRDAAGNMTMHEIEVYEDRYPTDL
ncbi:MAG: hypothetical protein JXB88_02120 [Spirochaetales bacterium]|nr:hypothetical protein [Spirochaetales bacterium]